MGREDTGILYDVLSADRRRRALAVLADAEEPLGRDEVARRLLVRRSVGDSPGTESNETRTAKVEISLGHIHLPKLEACGAVERTTEGEYGVTQLGYDLERAAQAFEARLGSDARRVEDSAVPPTNYSGTVSASECDGDR